MATSNLLLWIVLLGAVFCQRELETYNVDLEAISISGASSGGAAATQIHMSHSSVFMGVGLYAGIVYYCCEADPIKAVPCGNDEGIDPYHLSIEARDFANEGKIDDVLQLFDHRVFILQGDLDNLVDPGCADTIREFYEEFMPPQNIELVRISNLIHGFPTEDYGAECDRINPQGAYLNWCEYHGAFEMLNSLYGGNLTRPTSQTPVPGDFYVFDQEEFYNGLGSINGISMATRGFMYVPTGCIDRTEACRLHVALHGCNQGIDEIGDEFVSNSFYHHAAELNDIIILWPQATPSLVSPVNPQGCWDWWGYNDEVIGPEAEGNYATNLGDQTIAIMKMVERVAGGLKSTRL